MTEPILLPANQPADRFYRGGAKIAALRQVPYLGGNVPEDWVGSTTTLFGESDLGLTRLPDGRLLRDAVASDPASWLGEAHTAAFGDDTMLLTKLLDAGQRLPVHVHPDGEFAREHLGRAHGKTEAWVILTPGTVYLGFREDMDPATFADLVDRQDSAAMLEAMHAISVSTGDAVLVPAGFAHAIGEGILLVEVQEPEDLSILLEHAGFDLPPGSVLDLGLGWDLALRALDLSGSSAEEIEERLVTRARPGSVLPAEADRFFRVLRAHGGDTVEASFGVVVIIDGEGMLTWEGGLRPVAQGQTLVVPHALGPVSLEGPVNALWCLPPLP